MLKRKSDYKVMPWKNGLGLTAEIDKQPWWRLSQATITKDSAFSIYPGQDRLLMVWKGDGIFLNDSRLEPLAPVRFSGDRASTCRLIAGAVEDVGLIFERDKVEAEMRILEPCEFSRAGDVDYLFDLATGDTLKIESPLTVHIKRSLLIRIFIKRIP